MSAEASTSSAPPGLPQAAHNIPRSTTSARSLYSPAMPHPPSTSNSTHQASQISPSSLPHSPEQLRQIAEARTALDAQMHNIGSSLDRTLQSRAQNLHDNSKALEKQEKQVGKSTQGLKKENDKLAKMAAEGSRKVKELGNVQNWAEMLERDFLVLGETIRLANKGSDSGSYSGSDDGSWETESEDDYGKGWRTYGIPEEQDLGLLKYVSPLDGPLDGDGDTQMDDGPADAHGKAPETMDVEHEGHTPMEKGKQVVHMEASFPSQSASIEEGYDALGGSSTATATGSSADQSSSSIHAALSGTS